MKNSRCIFLVLGFIWFMFAAPGHLCAIDTAPGITEKTGEKVSLDAVFTDEMGESAPFKSLLGKPAILSFAYFGCKDQCNTSLSGLASAIGRTGLVPGEDYSVLTVSFDEADTQIEASRKKKDYMAASGAPVSDKAWRFLTGNKASIEALTGSVGFGFRRSASGFDHGAAVAVLSAEGRIIRYIYGSSFLPDDLEMALLEAREGRITASFKKAVLFCFGSTPGGRARLVPVLRVAGVSTLVLAAGVFIFLTSSRRPGKKDPR